MGSTSPRLWPWAAHKRQLTDGWEESAGSCLGLSMVGCNRQSEINPFLPELLLPMVYTIAAEKDRKTESPSSAVETVEVIAQGRNKGTRP